MFSRRLKLFALLALLTNLAGCAQARKISDPVKIENPRGKNVRSNGDRKTQKQKQSEEAEAPIVVFKPEKQSEREFDGRHPWKEEPSYEE